MNDKELIKKIKDALIIKNDDAYTRTPTNVGKEVGVTRQSVHHSRNTGTDTHDNKAALIEARRILGINEKGERK